MSENDSKYNTYIIFWANSETYMPKMSNFGTKKTEFTSYTY
jgi:hypothetical protein